jgi:amidohydrolase
MLRTLRSSLHACAEPSNAENLTARVVRDFVEAYGPDELITGLGGHGVAAVFEGAEPGPTVLVRCELDGLPVEETRAAPFGFYSNTAHRCGHDAHMTMVSGLAPLLSVDRPERGRVVLLYQPAEETGEGALRIIEDPEFPSIMPDYAIALHNLPGYPAHSVVCRRGTFASASVGMLVELEGVASHAAEPEKAITPSGALAQLIPALPRLTNMDSDPYRMLTLTHVRMGRESFGVTPGRATLCATLRAASDAALDELREEVQYLVQDAAYKDGLRVDVRWLERFPETRNADHLVGLLEETCRNSGVHTVNSPHPFRWSEDFGYFGRVCPVLLFGLGIGEDAPGLHQPEYSFPDEVLVTGVETLTAVARGLTAHAEMVALDDPHTTPPTDIGPV